MRQIKSKLMQQAPTGQGWTQTQADDAERQYKRFLHLVIAFPGTSIVPTAVIDAFWHQHILDTRAYARDCDYVVGHFVHHHPNYGDADERCERDLAYTKALYEQVFGSDEASVQRSSCNSESGNCFGGGDYCRSDTPNCAG